MRNCLALLIVFSALAGAQAPRRYALVLDQAPLAQQMLSPRAGSRASLQTASAEAKRQTLLRAQETLKFALRQRQIAVTGSVHTLANAVFVTVSDGREAELRAIPGVAAVVPVRTLHRTLNKALDQVNGAAARTVLNGAGSSGAGIKIAILDTGIDETHPGFQDASMTTPSGYPKTGNADDATHATNKIIAVRSFVSALANISGIPEFTRPDDLSARDRVGHGTAVAMIAAGVSHQSPLGTISGVAPKAWLGNYKIFGSPGINDSTTSDVVLTALEAAFNDGMDVALLSAGELPAMWAPGDSGAVCGLASGVPCDPMAAAVSNAGLGGMLIVLPAGNDGSLGLNTINTPGDAAAAITVGATTNSHTLAASISLPSGEKVQARLGDGPQLMGTLSASMLAAASVEATEHGCLGHTANAFSGKIALLSDGLCSVATKVLKAQEAGAVGVVIFAQSADSPLAAPAGLLNTGIPAAMVSAASGAQLKTYLAAHPSAVVVIDPATAETTLPPAAHAVAYFSSRGPNVGDSGIKPDLVAPGESILTAAQNYDPNGELYSANRYVGVDGTSFSAAVVAGAAALVKQAHPAYSTLQIKSALTNTASTAVVELDSRGVSTAARATAMGAGELNIGAAILSSVTVVPSAASFGEVSSTLPTRGFVITNTGATAVTLQFTVQQRDLDLYASVAVTPATLNLPAGASASISVALTGATPQPGTYEGAIVITGGAASASIPYLYLVGSGAASALMPLSHGFTTESGTAVDVAFRAVDQYGIPVSNAAVRFAPATSVYASTPTTDQLGIAEAYMLTAALVGEQSFAAYLAGNPDPITFTGRTRLQPAVLANGIVDAASFAVPAGFAPGSYLSIFGTGLSESLECVRTPYLPMSLAGVSLSFDVTATGIHVPGRFQFVSAGQVNAQIPWELAGSTSAVVKITVANSSSKSPRVDNVNLGTYQTQTLNIPIGTYSPGFFEYSEASTGKLLAAALDEQYGLIGSANPVQRGHVIQFFLNGLGPVTPGSQPPSGEPTPLSPLVYTQATPTVTIGGKQAQVQFSGLAPTLVGVYQVNAVTPPDIDPGLQAAVISIGGITSKTVNVPVR